MTPEGYRSLNEKPPHRRHPAYRAILSGQNDEGTVTLTGSSHAELAQLPVERLGGDPERLGRAVAVAVHRREHGLDVVALDLGEGGDPSRLKRRSRPQPGVRGAGR